jgi:hypothetical protein
MFSVPLLVYDHARSLTQSYDAHLRLYDTRNPSKILAEIELSGGIWRARFHPDPERSGDILCACMHGGFQVIRVDPAFLNLASRPSTGAIQWCKDIASFQEHKSLAYGADWCRLPAKQGGSLVVTCSFYDHAMHLWRAYRQALHHSSSSLSPSAESTSSSSSSPSPTSPSASASSEPLRTKTSPGTFVSLAGASLI